MYIESVPNQLFSKVYRMRKITELAVSAFAKGENFSMSNTKVVSGNDVKMFLHGNLIAKRSNNDVSVFDGGYQSNTTKERVNGVLRHYGMPTIYQKNFTWYYSDGTPFDK